MFLAILVLLVVPIDLSKGIGVDTLRQTTRAMLVHGCA
jgi:hypothetical protein